MDGSSTIAAIVTSLGGGPAAVGIVRLSGPAAVSIAGQVFRPARVRKSDDNGIACWRPTSHLVEYGVALDHQGNVIDEVSSCPVNCVGGVCFLHLVSISWVRPVQIFLFSNIVFKI